MPEDPIVADVRQARSYLLEAVGGSVDGLIRLLHSREQQAGRRPVELVPGPAADSTTRSGAV